MSNDSVREHLGQAHLRHLAAAEGLEAAQRRRRRGLALHRLDGQALPRPVEPAHVLEPRAQNRAVIDAIKQQAEELAFIAPGYTTNARAELCRRAARGAAQGAQQVLLHHLGHRGQRGGDQDRPHVHGQAQDHLALRELPRLDRGLGLADRRFPSLARRAARHRPRHRLRARRELLSLPAQEDVPRVRRSPAPTTSST